MGDHIKHIQIDDPQRDTTYYIVGLQIPSCYEFPWLDDECDVLVAIVDPNMLTEDVAEDLALELVKLNNDWIETMGKNSESLHDLIDNASVAIGRQAGVGAGDPMTGWHDDMVEMDQMIEWAEIGGAGGNDYKLIVVVGSSSSVETFAEKLRQAIANRSDDD